MHPWTPPYLHTHSQNTTARTELLGKHFIDFAKVDWAIKLAALGVHPKDALLVMDDHQDQLTRLKQARIDDLHPVSPVLFSPYPRAPPSPDRMRTAETPLPQARAFGFRHLIFDDNFLPGVGDAFSIKNACDGGAGGRSGGETQGEAHQVGAGRAQGCGGGALRAVFGPRRRCTNFHKACVDLNDAQMAEARRELLRLADVIWEGPPVAPIQDPYAAIRSLIRGSGLARNPTAAFQYEGPTATPSAMTWNATHSRRAHQAMKPPLLESVEVASAALGMPIDYLDWHASIFISMCYVKASEQA